MPSRGAIAPDKTSSTDTQTSANQPKVKRRGNVDAVARVSPCIAITNVSFVCLPIVSREWWSRSRTVVVPSPSPASAPRATGDEETSPPPSASPPPLRRPNVSPTRAESDSCAAPAARERLLTSGSARVTYRSFHCGGERGEGGQFRLKRRTARRARLSHSKRTCASVIDAPCVARDAKSALAAEFRTSGRAAGANS